MLIEEADWHEQQAWDEDAWPEETQCPTAPAIQDGKVDEEDVELARAELLGDPEIETKLLPLSTLVESADLSGCGCVPRDGVCGDDDVDSDDNSNSSDDEGYI